jgi:hypothetical protein
MNLILLASIFTIISGGNIDHSLLRGVPTSCKFFLSKLIYYEYRWIVLVLSRYVSSKPFACLDGSSVIPFEFVNDDYCDCRGR